MTETVSFPGLGLEFTIDRVAFSIAGFEFYWYGVILTVAILTGLLFSLRRAAVFDLKTDSVLDVIIASTIGGIIGARLYYVVFSWDNYKDNLLSIFNIREGGVAIYGALIGAVLVGLIACRVKKMPFLKFADLCSVGFCLGQAIGRWGNFVNIEAFGSNTTLPWGMASPKIENYLRTQRFELSQYGIDVDPAMPVHPTFFYESLWCAIGVVLLIAFTKKRRFNGEMFFMYLAWYGLGRFFIEWLRTDSLMIGQLRVSQVLAAVLFIGSVIMLIAFRRRAVSSKSAVNAELMASAINGEAQTSGSAHSDSPVEEAADNSSRQNVESVVSDCRESESAIKSAEAAEKKDDE